MTPSLDDLYQVLRTWALSQKIDTYLSLSNEYKQLTGDWFEPYGSWDVPLGALNQRLHVVGAPAISALVVKKDTMEPGWAFWGCAPNVLPCPMSDIERLAEWSKIVKLVHAFAWPGALR